MLFFKHTAIGPSVQSAAHNAANCFLSGIYTPADAAAFRAVLEIAQSGGPPHALSCEDMGLARLPANPFWQCLSLSNLQSVSICHNRIRELPTEMLGDMPNLSFFDASYNQIEVIPPRFFSFLRRSINAVFAYNPRLSKAVDAAKYLSAGSVLNLNSCGLGMHECMAFFEPQNHFLENRLFIYLWSQGESLEMRQRHVVHVESLKYLTSLPIDTPGMSLRWVLALFNKIEEVALVNTGLSAQYDAEIAGAREACQALKRALVVRNVQAALAEDASSDLRNRRLSTSSSPDKSSVTDFDDMPSLEPM